MVMVVASDDGHGIWTRPYLLPLRVLQLHSTCVRGHFVCLSLSIRVKTMRAFFQPISSTPKNLIVFFRRDFNPFLVFSEPSIISTSSLHCASYLLPVFKWLMWIRKRWLTQMTCKRLTIDWCKSSMIIWSQPHRTFWQHITKTSSVLLQLICIFYTLNRVSPWLRSLLPNFPWNQFLLQPIN